MNEIYWFTRLDELNLFFWIITGFLILILFIHILYHFLDDRNIDIKFSFKMVIYIVIFAALSILIPTTKDAYLIYGLGGTIDYIKQNDKAKQLPDKCIDALDKFIESINKNENKTKEN